MIFKGEIRLIKKFAFLNSHEIEFFLYFIFLTTKSYLSLIFKDEFMKNIKR